MQKNIITAVVVSIVFMLFWYSVVIPKYGPKKPSVGSNAVVSQTPSTTGDAAAIPMAQETAAADASGVVFDKYEFENDLLKIVFSEDGAGIENYFLKENRGYLDIVPPAAGLQEKNLFFRSLQGARFVKYAEEDVVIEGSGYSKISFLLDNKDKADIIKSYYISDNGYLHKFEFEIVNNTRNPVEPDNLDIFLGPGMKTGKNKDELKELRALGYKDFTVTSFKSGDYANDYAWVGLDSRYFLAALLGTGDNFKSIKVNKEKNMLPEMLVTALAGPIKSGETLKIQFPLYFGPKSYYDLRKLGIRLEEAIDFGFFGFLSKYALRILHILHNITKNYGFAIVILTVCLQILLFPLTAKSFKASLAMKKLQPKIKLLQEKYKQDPKRLNVEMLNLYKTSGTNPFGGCLPMIMQIPIFWALFTTLRNAYELRNAPFIFWIKDLSAPDPFYVLPVLMGIGMFFQQKFMSVATDPTQQKMMYIMPVVLTVLFINFPAGLVLYWLTNNIVTGVEQYIMLKVQESK